MGHDVEVLGRGPSRFARVFGPHLLAAATRARVGEAVPALREDCELLLLLDGAEITAAIVLAPLPGETGCWLDLHVSLLGGRAPDPGRMRHVFAAVRTLPQTLGVDGVAADVPVERSGLVAQLHRLGFLASTSPRREGEDWLVLTLPMARSDPALVSMGSLPAASLSAPEVAAPTPSCVRGSSWHARSLARLAEVPFDAEVAYWLGCPELPSGPGEIPLPASTRAFSAPMAAGHWTLLESEGGSRSLLVIDQHATLRSRASLEALRRLTREAGHRWGELRVLLRGDYRPAAASAYGLVDLGATVDGTGRVCVVARGS